MFTIDGSFRLAVQSSIVSTSSNIEHRKNKIVYAMLMYLVINIQSIFRQLAIEWSILSY